MLHAMLCRQNADHYLLPVLTSYVRKQTDKDLADALIKVKAMKEAERENGQHVVSADEAMKYLLCLVDVNRLYNVALGLYDFDLVMFVAAKSNKDPKEYLPFLNKLRRSDFNIARTRLISVSYRLATIDINK
jgi:elongator complex protein 1